LSDADPNRKYAEYFNKGTVGGHSAPLWVKSDAEAGRPQKIVDEREGQFYLKLGVAV
jgi:hypothetical protein